MGWRKLCLEVVKMHPRLMSPEFHRLVELLVDRFMDRTIMENYVEWALSELEAGLDTSNLRILAGLSQPLYFADVDHYFKATLVDLEIDLPPGDVLLRQWACQIAYDIASGVKLPQEGCAEISALYRHLDYTPELHNWDVLEDGYLPEGSGYSAGLNSAIVDEAKALLASSFCIKET
jgi:hypothetical protein